jgi:hypothetical protein
MKSSTGDSVGPRTRSGVSRKQRILKSAKKKVSKKTQPKTVNKKKKGKKSPTFDSDDLPPTPSGRLKWDYKRAFKETHDIVKKGGSLDDVLNFLNSDQEIPVGGSIRKLNVHVDLVAPIIDPKTHHVSGIILRGHMRRIMNVEGGHIKSDYPVPHEACGDGKKALKKLGLAAGIKTPTMYYSSSSSSSFWGPPPRPPYLERGKRGA